MPSFSDKLKHERESRNTPLADVARRTRIGIQYLEALERGDFDGLPGRRGFGKLYIRVYADLFGFDPEPLISEYDEERLKQELLSEPDLEVEPERPRKIRFVPRARKSSAGESKAQAPTPPVEEPTPEPVTAPMEATEPVVPSVAPREEEPTPEPVTAPMEATEPVVPSVAPREEEPTPEPVTPPLEAIFPVMPSVAPREAEIVEPAEVVARPAMPGLPAEPDVVTEAVPTEPNVPSVTQAGTWVTEGAPSWKRRAAWGAVVVVVLGAVGVALMMRTSRPVDPPVPELPAAAGPVTPAAEPRSEPDAVAGSRGMRPSSADSQVALAAPALPDPSPVSTAPAAATPQPAESVPLDVSEFDLGIGVTDLQVVDVRREFEEGAVASFLTRVRGGAPGQTITHVWIRDGLLVQSLELRLGSPNWRTYSNKTLWDTGEWAVEARDENGEVLARVEFRCVPAE